MDRLPKILVCSPTARVKDYCFDAWIDNVMGFSYPLFDVAVFDNTDNTGAYSDEINRRVSDKYGPNSRFTAYNSLLLNKVPSHQALTMGVIQKMALSHNDCRRLCYYGNYDYILHLETDVFPPPYVIESLLLSGEQVVGGLYYIDEGSFRKPMFFLKYEIAEGFIRAWPSSVSHEVLCFSEDLVEVATVGLGCTLIKRDVFKRVIFRHIPGLPNHPDTYFFTDCTKSGIKSYLNPRVVCKHENSSWGIYGLNYK